MNNELLIDTSIIRPSRRSRFLKIEAWHLQICESNQAAAALLAFLISYHNNRQDDKTRAIDINSALSKQDKPARWNETDWQFHTDQQLIDGIMLFKTDAIIRGKTFLVEKNFLFVEPPDDLKAIFKTGRTKWFCLNHIAINQWINDNYSNVITETASVSMISGEIVSVSLSNANNSTDLQIEQIDNSLSDVKNLFEFWKITTKSHRSVLDAKRVKLIKARLKQYSAPELAQAILGNHHSAFHQGDNDTKKVFDSIELILRDASKVEQFCRIAISAGVTAESAMISLEKALSIELQGETQPEPIYEAKPEIPACNNLSSSQRVRLERIADHTAMLLISNCGFDIILSHIQIDFITGLISDVGLDNDIATLYKHRVERSSAKYGTFESKHRDIIDLVFDKLLFDRTLEQLNG